MEGLNNGMGDRERGWRIDFDEKKVYTSIGMIGIQDRERAVLAVGVQKHFQEPMRII